jgi:hypothetical protein
MSLQVLISKGGVHAKLTRWKRTDIGERAEGARAQIERRFASRKVEIEIERFELNPGKSDVVRFLNEHCE